MKRNIDVLSAASWSLAALLYLAYTPLQVAAQTMGYVSSDYGIQPFDPANASLLGWIHVSVPEVGVPAVSLDGRTLYVPFEGSGASGVALGILSAINGELTGRVPGVGDTTLVRFINKVMLSPNGATAYVMCNDSNEGPSLIGVVNLATKTVTGYFVAENGQFIDAALSPDGAHIFASVQDYRGSSVKLTQTAVPQANVPLYECSSSSTICEFSTSTFALENQTKNLFGNLKVSQDGNSLYVILGTGGFDLYVVNTSTFATSTIKFAFPPLSMAVAPSGNQAVIADSTLSFALEESVLDTQSNTIVGSLPAPSIPSDTYLGPGSNTMAFSPDGTSLWTLLCSEESCTQTLVGQSFPSGKLIGEVTLPKVGGFNAVVF